MAPKNTDLLREQNLRKIEDHLSEVARLSASCSLDKETVIEMVNLLWEEQ